MFNEDLFQNYVRDCLGDAIDGEADKVMAIEFAVGRMEEIINSEADDYIDSFTDTIENYKIYGPRKE